MANGEWRMANGEWRMANGEIRKPESARCKPVWLKRRAGRAAAAVSFCIEPEKARRDFAGAPQAVD